MSPGTRILLGFLVQWILALALVLGGGTPSQHASLPEGLRLGGLGLLVGFLLFFALSKGRSRVGGKGPRSWRSPLLPAIVVATSVAEEVIWRGFVLFRLVLPIGPVFALLVATLGFSLAHLHPGGRTRAWVHGGTGLVLGVVFLATGALLAPIIAHVSYNLLVLAWGEPVASSGPEETAKRGYTESWYTRW